jgi:hypothetical protein
METDTATRDRDQLRWIVAALWPSHVNRHLLLGPDETQIAAECVAWALAQNSRTASEAEEVISGAIPDGTEADVWRLVAHTMEGSRDRAIAAQQCLLDVAAAAVILLCSVEDSGAYKTEAERLKDALLRYDRMRSR